MRMFSLRRINCRLHNANDLFPYAFHGRRINVDLIEQHGFALQAQISLQPDREIVGLKLAAQTGLDEMVVNRVHTHFPECLDELRERGSTMLDLQYDRLGGTKIEWRVCHSSSRCRIGGSVV